MKGCRTIGEAVRLLERLQDNRRVCRTIGEDVGI
jgi:hypothetical protein